MDKANNELIQANVKLTQEVTRLQAELNKRNEELEHKNWEVETLKGLVTGYKRNVYERCVCNTSKLNKLSAIREKILDIAVAIFGALLLIAAGIMIVATMDIICAWFRALVV